MAATPATSRTRTGISGKSPGIPECCQLSKCGAAVRVDVRQLLNEADLAVLCLKKNCGECHDALFHARQHMPRRFPFDVHARSYRRMKIRKLLLVAAHAREGAV